MDYKTNNYKNNRGGDFGKREFSRPNFSNNRAGGFHGDKEMFQATCASCGKTCEVPFRPNGKKPVYCKECFALNGGPSTDSRGPQNFAPRQEFAPRPAYKPESRPQTGVDTGELKRSIEAMNSKLDRLVQLLTDKAEKTQSAPAKKEATSPSLGSLVAKVTKTAAKAPAKKVVAKKATPKKKK